MTKERLIGTTETALILGVGKDTVIRLIEAGALRANKLPGPNGAYVLSEAAVIAYKQDKAEAS